MKIGNVLNDFTMPGGESTIARAVADRLGAARFERSSSEWSDLSGLRRLPMMARSFRNEEVVASFRQWAEREQLDVVIFHNIFPVLSPAIVEEAKRLGLATVVYLHSYRYLCANGFFLNHGEPCERCIHGNFWPAAMTACWRDSFLLSAWYGAILSTLRPRGFFKAVDHFVSVSEFVRQKYAAAGISPEKISTLHNFFDCSNIKPCSEDDGYVLFIGRLSEEKGVMTLLEAARLVPDIPIRIAGDGPVFDPAWKFLTAHSLKNITLEGFVEGDRKRELICRARFVVVPSEWNEPFPTVVPESYAHGKPVLASRAGGLIEMIETARTGDFFTSRHPQSLAEGLRRMFDSRERTREWGINGRRWVEKNCDPRSWENSIRAILQNTLPGRPAS